MVKLTTTRSPATSLPASRSLARETANRFLETLVGLARQAITADTLTLGFALLVLLKFVNGFWYRVDERTAVTGWQLMTNGSLEGVTLTQGIGAFIALVPLLSIVVIGAVLFSLMRSGQAARVPAFIAWVGLAIMLICGVYLLEIAGTPRQSRALDLGFWLSLSGAMGLVIQLYFNRPVAISQRTRFGIMAALTFVNMLLYSLTLAMQIARSRSGDSVAFEITSLIGLALYGAAIGTYITGNIFRRKGHNPRLGRLIGAIVGAFGHLLLLIPLWIYTPTTADAPRQRIKIDEITWGMVLLFPWLASFILLTVYPMLDSYRVALYNWQGFGEPSQFVGLRHVKNVIEDPIFWRSLRNTVTYTAVLVPIQLSLALMLALILNRKRMQFAVLYRTIFFLPAVTSVAVVAVVMRLILGNFGINLSELVGINPPVNPISDARLALVSVIGFGIWHSFGVNLIYFLAALQTVPEELYDAAQVDGANWFQQLIHITLPSIRPISVIVIFMAFIGSMYVFEQSFVLTRGGPYFASQVVTGYIYNYAFRQPGTQLTPNFGYASAAALFFAVIMLGLTVTNYVITNRMRRNA
ncbi:MAG: sugar ABC transporter permease [bacterium]|nr:sugar ABC transporter permease [bacterium]